MQATFPIPVRTVAPTFQPMTVEELQQRIPVAGNHWNAVLRDALAEGIDRFEHDTGLVCCTSTWQEKLDEWPECGYIRLQRRPVASASSITYLDGNGDSQTWASSNYTLDSNRAVPAIFPTYSATFPALRGIENSVTITYVAGYTSAVNVPQMAKFAIVGAVKQSFGMVINDSAMVEDGTQIYERLVERFRRASYP